VLNFNLSTFNCNNAFCAVLFAFHKQMKNLRFYAPPLQTFSFRRLIVDAFYDSNEVVEAFQHFFASQTVPDLMSFIDFSLNLNAPRVR
jgi:hypothetical protein